MVEIIEGTFGNHCGYKVVFTYKPWLVDAIKKVPGARFYNYYGEKFWFVPKSSEVELEHFASSAGLVKQLARAEQIGEIEPLPELDIDIDQIIYHREKKAKGEPHLMFPYQKQGVAYSLQKKKLIIGDDMGLGKTVQAIATLTAGEAKCILIVCPATLKENWKREWKAWADKDAIILSSRTKKTWPQYFKVGLSKVFICNYESLKTYFVESIDQPIDAATGEKKPLRLNHIKFKQTIGLFDAVVFDELHRCKDGRRIVSKLCMGISRGKEWILGMTGTPVVNKPKDLISQLYITEMLNAFGGYKGFVDRYCQGYSEASNLKELNFILNKTGFYRRLKKDVLHDFPDKIRNVLKVEISNRQEYQKAEDDFISYLRENLNKTEGEITTALRGQAMVLMGVLKKICARGKIDAMIEYAQEVVDSGEKIIVFAWHKEIVAEIASAIPGSVTVTGDSSLQERQKAVDYFQNDPKTKCIICNFKSGGVGITLTSSPYVSFIELPWHPADADQAEDRSWRIGQGQKVDCRYILGINTIDEHIYKIIEEKRKIVAQVTGVENEIETSVIDEVINLFTNKLRVA